MQCIGLCSPRSGRLGDAPARAVGGSGGLLEGGAVQKQCSPVATQYRAGRPACGGACVGSVIGAYRAVPVCVLVGIGRVSVCGVGVLGGLWPADFVPCALW